MGTGPTAGDLERHLEDAVAALRRYVSVARGVREEFDADQADLDPRVEEAATSLGLALGRLEDDFEDELGFVPFLEPLWEGSTEDDGPDEPDGRPAPLTADEFTLGLVVGVVEGSSAEQLDGVLGVVDDAAARLVGQLEGAGLVVTEYYVARGDHPRIRPADPPDPGPQPPPGDRPPHRRPPHGEDP